MKTQEIVYNGQKVNIVTSLDEDDTEYVLLNEEDTMDLTDVLDNTVKVEINND